MQQLDRDPAIELGVVRRVHHTHSSLAQLALDMKPPHGRPDQHLGNLHTATLQRRARPASTLALRDILWRTVETETDTFPLEPRRAGDVRTVLQLALQANDPLAPPSRHILDGVDAV